MGVRAYSGTRKVSFAYPDGSGCLQRPLRSFLQQATLLLGDAQPTVAPCRRLTAFRALPPAGRRRGTAPESVWTRAAMSMTLE